MAGIVTEKRKEELEDLKIQLEELGIYIQRVIDGKSSLAEITRIYNTTPQRMNDAMNNGIYAILKRLQILNNSDIDQLLKDSKSPAEKLIGKILCTDELIILSIAEEEKILKIMETVLTEKQYQVIRYRYGFDCRPKSQAEIALLYNNTKERIGQIEAKALRKLREPRYLKTLLPDYDLSIKELKENNTMSRLNTEVQRQKASANINFNEIPVRDLDISVRAYNCLHRKGIETIGELSKCTVEDLMKIRNCGPGTIKEINDALEKQFGLKLKHEDPFEPKYYFA